VTSGLQAPHEVAFAYRRSAGGADRIFLSGLANAEIWASRSAAGRLAVPPVDWDPETGEAVDGFVRLGDHGVVRSWSWVEHPRPDHPLDRPFGFALVQLAGADTSLLHVVDAGEATSMRTGMTVRADWRSERAGSIRDIRAFIPWPPAETPRPVSAQPADNPDLIVVSDLRLAYTYEPGLALSGFLKSLSERRIQGGRCPSCGAVYVPPRSRCPACRTGPMTPVTVAERGTITTYTEVHLPFHGIRIDLPFICAWIRLDGASVPFAHLLGETSRGDVRVGQRVEAVWAADAELGPTWESIRYFRPVEP
jgi:uncharacterized OB-fold protein